MRRILYFIIAGISLVMIASCEQDDWGDDGNISAEILFAVPTVQVNVDEGTRAVTPETLKKTSFVDDDAFAVWGYCLPYIPGSTNFAYTSGTGAWETKRALSVPHIFYTSGNNFLNTVKVGEAQTGAISRLWYKSGKGLDGTNNTNVGADAANYLYTFFAYYPAGDTGFKVNGGAYTSGQLKVQYTMPYSGGTKNNPTSIQLDGGTYVTNDVMLASVEDHKSSDGKVAFTFQHLLTGFSFQVNNFTAYKDDEGNVQGKTLKVKKICLSGPFHKTVNIDFFNNFEATYSDTYWAKYIIYSNDPGVEIPYNGENSQVLGNPLLLLSGDKDKVLSSSMSDVELYVLYELGGKEDDISLRFIADNSFIPKAGTHYTIHLNWVGDSFVLLLPKSQNSWDDGEGDDENADNDDVVFE